MKDKNSIRYAGYQYDSETEVRDANGKVIETGLYYLNARMYDPKVARFLQEDTYRGQPNDPLSLNLYTYVKNSPLIYYDPTGHINIGFNFGNKRFTIFNNEGGGIELFTLTTINNDDELEYVEPENSSEISSSQWASNNLTQAVAVYEVFHGEKFRSDSELESYNIKRKDVREAIKHIKDKALEQHLSNKIMLENPYKGSYTDQELYNIWYNNT